MEGMYWEKKVLASAYEVSWKSRRSLRAVVSCGTHAWDYVSLIMVSWVADSSVDRHRRSYVEEDVSARAKMNRR